MMVINLGLLVLSTTLQVAIKNKTKTLNFHKLDMHFHNFHFLYEKIRNIMIMGIGKSLAIRELD